MKASFPLLLIVMSFSAQAGEESRHGSDLARLQGRWTARAGNRREIRVELEIQGRQVAVNINTPQGLEFKAEGQVSLDESTTPRSLDWKNLSLNDDQALPEIPGVYKLDGESFMVHNGGFHGPRPKDFRPGEGIMGDVIVFRRVNPDETKTATSDKPAPRSAPSGPARIPARREPKETASAEPKTEKPRT